MARGVRLVFESGRPIAQVARNLGVPAEALRLRVRRAEVDVGQRGDLLSSQEREEIRKLRKENYELRRRTRFLRARQCFLPRSSTQTERGERLC
jgi:transposase